MNAIFFACANMPGSSRSTTLRDRERTGADIVHARGFDDLPVARGQDQPLAAIFCGQFVANTAPVDRLGVPVIGAERPEERRVNLVAIGGHAIVGKVAVDVDILIVGARQMRKPHGLRP